MGWQIEFSHRQLHGIWNSLTFGYSIAFQGVGKLCWKIEKYPGEGNDTPLQSVLLPGKSHGWRSLVGCNPWGHGGSDMTEWLHFHFSLSCIGEGNGNPLQGSCLENPRDGGAWLEAVYGVAQSRTRLKRLSSKVLLQLYLCLPQQWFVWIRKIILLNNF